MAGWLFGWPWLDPVASWALRRWYFPLSRLWAAASIAAGSPERFFEAAPLDPLRSRRYGLQELLTRFEESRVYAEAVDAAWHRAFFEESGMGGPGPSPVECLAFERARLASRHRYHAMRWDFRKFLRPELPSVRYAIPTPEDVDAAYGAALTEPAMLFQAPDPMPEVSVSRRIPVQDGHDYWLSFQSPSARLGDRVFARVHEPAGIENPPTIIFGHGVCIEFDHWRGLIDEAGGLRGRGFRVIRPEAPWHGRRAPRGTYGGERMIATFPMGSLDLLTGAVREWAILADWARRTSSGPLSFGGSSLGAMTAQLVADRARDWPRRLRPDALLLITHCWQLDDAMQAGELMRIWGGQEMVEAQGWSEERVHAYLSLLAPGPVPGLSPDRIVTILGRRDCITPFASGLKLIDRWGVPEANRFIWDRGHFSIPVTLMRSAAPFERFCELMHEAL
jgi:pimeloyl-ACP methyl ester carboxylesterase